MLSWYLRQPESHQLSLKKGRDLEGLGHKDRTPGLHGSNRKAREVLVNREMAIAFLFTNKRAELHESGHVLAQEDMIRRSESYPQNYIAPRKRIIRFFLGGKY